MTNGERRDDLIQVAVERGATILDQHVPRWADLIDLETLNMPSCSNCILGQLYGDFDSGATKLFGGSSRHQWRSQEVLEKATTHGLLKPAEWEQSAWKDLRDAWMAAIRDRRRGQRSWRWRG